MAKLSKNQQKAIYSAFIHHGSAVKALNAESKSASPALGEFELYSNKRDEKLAEAFGMSLEECRPAWEKWIASIG